MRAIKSGKMISTGNVAHKRERYEEDKCKTLVQKPEEWDLLEELRVDRIEMDLKRNTQSEVEYPPTESSRVESSQTSNNAVGTIQLPNNGRVRERVDTSRVESHRVGSSRVPRVLPSQESWCWIFNFVSQSPLIRRDGCYFVSRNERRKADFVS
jgi:hypothetical protein